MFVAVHVLFDRTVAAFLASSHALAHVKDIKRKASSSSEAGREHVHLREQWCRGRQCVAERPLLKLFVDCGVVSESVWGDMGYSSLSYGVRMMEVRLLCLERLCVP